MGKSNKGGKVEGAKIANDQNLVRRTAKARQKANARAAALHKNKEQQEWVPLALVARQTENFKIQQANKERQHQTFLDKVIADRKAKATAAFNTLKTSGFVEIREGNEDWAEKEFLSVIKTVKQFCKDDFKVSKQFYLWEEVLPGLDGDNKIMGVCRFSKKR